MTEQPNPTFADPSTVPVTPVVPSTPEEIRSQLIGADKKYKSEEEALKGLFHSQNHIQTLEREAAAREVALSQAKAESKSVNDILAAIDAKKLEQPVVPSAPINNDGLNPPVQETTASEAPMSKETLQELVQQYVDEDRTLRTKESNFNKAVTALDGKYGSRKATNEAVQAKATELGVDVGMLKSMAEQSPSGFLKLMSDGSQNQAKEKSVGATPSSINTEAFSKHAPASAGAPKPGTHRYYRALKKSDPGLYKRTYQQQMKEMAADPDAFYERTS